MTKRLLLPLLILNVGLMAACDDDSGPIDVERSPDAAAGPEAGAPVDATPALTYWEDIAPVLNQKCVKCHQTGDIAPFPLDNYQDVASRAQLIAQVTKEGRMPPFLVAHDGSCGNFEDGDTLTPDELARIQAWAQGDLAEGSPTTLTRPPIFHLETGVDFQTPELQPVIQGGVLAEFDEYRCYLIEPGLSKDSYVKSFEVRPGNRALVHHVAVFLIDGPRKTKKGPTNLEIMQAEDAKSPDRPGWPCFGVGESGLEIDSLPMGWVPGQGPTTFPMDSGVFQRQTDKIVIQVHYNLSDPRVRGQTDVTRLRVHYVDQVGRPAMFLFRDGLLESLFRAQPQTLPPGEKSTRYSFTVKAADLWHGLTDVPYLEAVTFSPHMHERGTRKTMSIGKPGEAKTCLARVDRWDFHWQRSYQYKGALPRVTPEDEIEVTCEYDTSKDTAPIQPGWGTRNEMCTGSLILLPPQKM